MKGQFFLGSEGPMGCLVGPGMEVWEAASFGEAKVNPQGSGSLISLILQSQPLGWKGSLQVPDGVPSLSNACTRDNITHETVPGTMLHVTLRLGFEF